MNSLSKLHQKAGGLILSSAKWEGCLSLGVELKEPILEGTPCGRHVGNISLLPPTLCRCATGSRHKNASVQLAPQGDTDQSPHLGEHPGYTTWMLGKREGLGFWKLLVESLGV